MTAATPLAFPVIDTEAIIVARRLALHRFLKHLTDGDDQRLEYRTRRPIALHQGRRQTGGPYLRSVQRFARVDVAESSNDALVEQRRLDVRPSAAQRSRQEAGAEVARQRLRPQPAQG